MLTVIALTWTLSTCCPLVEQHRAMGLTDQQIEKLALDYKVPKWVIAWAKRHCRAA